MNEFDGFRATLTSAPDWERLNAYERTKRCCAEFTRLGKRIPNWMSIRDIIGKGSANDINRGKEDFRREHGNALRKMSGFMDGVPEVLAPHILGFWTAAIAHVREEFEGQVAEWQVVVEQAELTVTQAEADRDQAIGSAETLKGQLEGLQEAKALLERAVDAERSARESAEKMFGLTLQEVAGQRDELRTELARSQQNVSEAITRLEGVERHALREVDRARTEAQKTIADIEAKHKRENSDCALELVQVTQQLQELNAQLTTATLLNSRLASENARLSATPRPSQRSSFKKKK